MDDKNLLTDLGGEVLMTIIYRQSLAKITFVISPLLYTSVKLPHIYIFNNHKCKSLEPNVYNQKFYEKCCYSKT